MGTKRTMILAAALAAGGIFAADVPPATAPAGNPDVKAVVETIQSLSGLLQNLDAAAGSLAEGQDEGASVKTGQVDQPGRPLKNTIAIITAGAAAGASLGAATRKGTQAVVIGAIAGAAAGLIYDRMTAEKKNPAAAGPAAPSGEVNQPEVSKQSGKPVPAAVTPSV